MPEFLEYVLWELRNSFLLVFVAGIAALAVLVAAYSLHQRKYRGERKFPWGKAFLWLIFIGYMAIVLYATILRNSGGYREWNLHLFRAWREAWNNFSAKNWANVLLNIAMFVPFGFLLPLLGRKYRKWYVAVPVGFTVSLAIELLQLAASSGICDVDDLFCNTLGSAIGYFVIMAILSLFHERGKHMKSVLAYACLTLIPMCAIGSIFIAYHMQEYGNLPTAAGYRVDLQHLLWKLDCDLPDSSEKIPVYRTQTMSNADCDAFAEELASLTGQEVLMVSYYQEMAYYNLTRGTLMVYYHDGSYAFGGYDHDIMQWDEADRETVEKALQMYPIVIPDDAEYTYDGDGWYSFTCKRQIDGAVMTDGILRVRYGVNDTVRRIENDLIWYTYYRDVAVISPEEAYEELKRGAFSYADELKHCVSASVTVISCTIDYEIDTKGFYQPVYLFEILIPETGNTCLAMIPAMK